MKKYFFMLGIILIMLSLAKTSNAQFVNGDNGASIRYTAQLQDCDAKANAMEQEKDSLDFPKYSNTEVISAKMECYSKANEDYQYNKDQVGKPWIVGGGKSNTTTGNGVIDWSWMPDDWFCNPDWGFFIDET